MAFKLVTIVKFEDPNNSFAKTEWREEEMLESTVPAALIDAAGRPVSYAEYKTHMLQGATAPFIGPEDYIIGLRKQGEDKVFTINRKYIDSATAEIIKTLD